MQKIQPGARAPDGKSPQPDHGSRPERVPEPPICTGAVLRSGSPEVRRTVFSVASP